MRKNMLVLMSVSTTVGILCSLFFPEHMLALRWLDKLFVDLLKLIVIPLTFFSIVSSIISMGSVKRFKVIWIYATVYVFISMLVAIAIGIALSAIFQPGVGVSPNQIFARVTYQDIDSIKILSFVHHFIPKAILEAAGKFEILPVVFFSIIFAIACIAAGQSAKPVVQVVLGMRNIFNKMITWLIYLTPAGLFALWGAALTQAITNNTIMSNVSGLCWFLLVFMLGLLAQFACQLLLVIFVVRKNPYKFLLNAMTALLTAFSASSSMATLPITLLAAKDEKISEEVANFVVPYTTIINVTGSVMYEGVATLFFCQIMGMHLTILAQIGIFITAIVAGLGARGIPESGVITLAMVMRSASVPTSASAILLPFEHLLDRLRSVVTVWGDLVCAATVDHFVREKVAHPRATSANERNIAHAGSVTSRVSTHDVVH